MGSRDRNHRPTMHQAICSNCGKPCQVPFKPTTGKPIFCSDCFEKQDGGQRSRPGRFEQRRFEPRRSDSNSYRGNRRPETSSYRGGDDNRQVSSNNAEQYRSQFEALNRKLDKILKMITPAEVETVVEVKAEEPKAKPKRATKKATKTSK